MPKEAFSLMRHKRGQPMKKLLLILGVVFTAIAVQAECGPGRSQTAPASVAPVECDGSFQAVFLPQATPITQTSSAIAEAYTPDIQALAENLGNDPTRIFNYVHDQIRYVHYFGSKKGAELTLLERSGNDFDQCALLSSLLQADENSLRQHEPPGPSPLAGIEHDQHQLD
jgi:hypothetical protein